MYPQAGFLISPFEQELLEDIKLKIDALPDVLDLGHTEGCYPIGLDCHILSEAIVQAYPNWKITRIDGWHRSYISTNHSWCRLPSGNILDVYPVGILGGPILVYVPPAGKMFNLIHEVYIEEKDTTDPKRPGLGNKHFKLDIFESIRKKDFETGVNKLLPYFKTNT
jgi:hypothetical protein